MSSPIAQPPCRATAHASTPQDPWTLEVDLGPFNAAFPKIQRTQNIGEGATFLNRVLSNKMFQHDATGAGLLAEFLVDITAVEYPSRYHIFEFFLFPKQFISCSI